MKKIFSVTLLIATILPVSCKKDDPATIPDLTTTAITSITSSTASGGGNITDDNGSDITARGVCWGTATGPAIAGSHTSDGTGKGSFSSSLTGLAAGTMYYVRAYATNGAGTAYGNEVTFTTLATAGLATLTTAAVTAITSISATSGGDITDDNGSDITARGVCWGTATGPTVAGSHSTDGTGTGVFSSSLTGLAASTMYYVRSYATNGAGTAYGNEVTFTTSAVAGAATLSTSAVTAITAATATSGGNITDDNGSDITARGVCWGTAMGPTVAGSHTTDGTGTGVFSSSLTGLAAGTTYYVRAYATNDAGTAYGNEVSFTTTATISEVSIVGMAFSPQNITIAVNTFVKWTNNDGITHDVTSNTGVFSSGSMANGSTYSFQFTTTGTFDYYCSIHPSMTGRIIVE